jgi:sigma-B regulation protein RsbU (phosphoserine phosphatase)
MAAVMWGIAAAIWSTSLDSKLRIVLFVACAVAVVVTTGNLRRRSVDWVDRKFFREAYRSEQILSELNESIRTIIDERSLLETVVLQIEESLHVPSVAILLNHGGELKIGFSIGCEQPETISLDEQSFVIKRIRGSSDPGSIYLDVPDNWVLNGPQSEIAMLRRMETQRLLPIAIRERLLGVLSLGMKRSEEPYSKHDIQLLKSVAFQTALALENSRLANVIALEMAEREKLNREIEIAREVQERLFPQDLPALPGIDYHGACRPAQGVGGDYYDFIPLANGNIGIAVGDVSGKGIAAALLMASLQASLRGQALQSSDDLARIMRNVNRLVFNATPSNRYATFFYAQYDRATRRLTYVNAGHNPPMILRRIGSLTHVIRLDTGGPVIGLFQDAPYQQASLTLEPGDVFIGFTDGISEAMNDADEEWGEERLVPALEACASQRASQMIPSIMAAADLFVNGAPQHDDMTMVVMKLEAAAA